MTNLSKERKRAEGKSVSAPVKSELSRQLCEICGIEPKLDGSNPALSVQPVYPDFEQVENFVKFLDIIHARMSIEGLLMLETDGVLFTRRFLKLVIKFLSGELGYVETKIDAVKQATRAEEWIYG